MRDDDQKQTTEDDDKISGGSWGTSCFFCVFRLNVTVLSVSDGRGYEVQSSPSWYGTYLNGSMSPSW